MYQTQTQNRRKTQRNFFKKSSDQSDSFVKYEHSINPTNTAEFLKQYNGSNLAFWALGAGKFGHLEEAEKQASRIKGGNY